MKLVFISDTHTRHKHVAIQPCDILFHAGDLTGRGEAWAVRNFIDWFDKQPAKHKVFIAGNHDFFFQNQKPVIDSYLRGTTNLHFLNVNSIILEGLKIWGSPWTPWFHDWAFNFPALDTGKVAAAHWNQIPHDVDVLLTHGPPNGIHDEVSRTMPGEDPHVGCHWLRERVREVNPIIHAFGHIHEQFGTSHIDNTQFINASTCTIQYKPTNRPFVVELNGKKIEKIYQG